MKILEVLATTLILSILCGCQIQKVQSVALSPSTSSGSREETASTVGLPLIQLSDMNMRTLQSGTNDGAYIIIENYSDSDCSNIMYIDYNATMCVPLCSQPNCTHDGDFCTSWIDGIGNTNLFVLNDKLYIIHLATIDAKGNPTPRRIEEMDLNGQNRHTLFELEANQIFLFSGFVGNADAIYFNVQETDPITGDNFCYTYRYCFQDGKLMPIYTCDGVADFIVGVVDDKILAKHISWDRTGLSDPSAMEKQIHELYLLNQEGKVVEEEVLSWEQWQYRDACYDSTVYLLDTINGSLTVKNVKENTEKIINNDFFRSSNGGTIVSAVDEGAIIAIEPDDMTEYPSYYLYHNGTVIKSQYSYLGSYDENSKNYIVAQTDTCYLVLRNSRNEQYSLVAKSDYWCDHNIETDIKISLQPMK